tara:strand:+ start:5012 stop:5455 length:444 start_codon:yes stop_codon:yes gene_type:complete
MRHLPFNAIMFFAMLLIMSIGFATGTIAQTTGPNSLLNQDQFNDPSNPTNPTDPKKETPPPTTSQEWIGAQRPMMCNSIPIVKGWLLLKNQSIIGSGHKPKEYIPSDPFNGVILLLNPDTTEYTILLINAEYNLACIVASGASFYAK